MSSESHRDGSDQERTRAIVMADGFDAERKKLLEGLKKRYEEGIVQFGRQTFFDGSDQYEGERRMWLDRVCKLCVLYPLLNKGGVSESEAKAEARRALTAKLPHGAGELEAQFDAIFKNAYGVILKAVTQGVEGYLGLKNASDPSEGEKAVATTDDPQPEDPSSDSQLDVWLSERSEQDSRPQDHWTIKRSLRDKLAIRFRKGKKEEE